MIFKSGFIVAFGTLISRFTGLARELFIASMFGTTYIADCINVALRLPNLLRRIFGEGALSAVFIPIFSKKLYTSSREAKLFAGKIFALLLLVLICITILIQILMPKILCLIVTGFTLDSGDEIIHATNNLANIGAVAKGVVAEKGGNNIIGGSTNLFTSELNQFSKFELTVILCRITMPYIIFASVSALLGGMLQARGQFFAFAFSPIIVNISIILFPYLFSSEDYLPFSIMYSLLIAGILQILFLYVYIWYYDLQFKNTC